MPPVRPDSWSQPLPSIDTRYRACPQTQRGLYRRRLPIETRRHVLQASTLIFGKGVGRKGPGLSSLAPQLPNAAGACRVQTARHGSYNPLGHAPL